MGDSFAWTIPLIQAGFGVLFLVARRAGAAAEAGWWGVAYLLTAGAFLVPLAGPMLPDEAIAVTADTLFAAAFYAYGGALLARYGGPGSPRLLPRLRLALLAVSVVAPAVGVLGVRELWAELVASDVTCSLEIGLPLLLVPLWPRGGIDRGLVGLSWLVVLDNLVRTASVPLTAAGATISTFVGTEYDYLMQATAMVEGFAFASLALVAVVSDVVAGHRRDALVDPLTGLLNRRGLDALAGAGAGGLPVGRVDGVVSCDLDHFKHVNDSLGHEAGDRVLAAFAELVRHGLPAGGLAARTGGEEFVLLLPGHSLAAAQAVAAGLRAAMAGFDWSSTGIAGPQTASFGVAVRVGRDRETLADAIARADARLYEAKRAGRDRIAGAQAA